MTAPNLDQFGTKMTSLPQDESTGFMFYFAIVAFMQLLLVFACNPASAQNLNLPAQLNQITPSLQPVTPNLSARRSDGGGSQHPDQDHHSAHRKHKSRKQ
jgi:hypothetical protein